MKSILTKTLKVLDYNLFFYLIIILFYGIMPWYFPMQNRDFFKAYYYAGQSVLSTGTFSYRYQGFTNLPIMSLLFTPFAAAGDHLGVWIFIWSEIVVLSIAFIILSKNMANSRQDRVVLLLLLLSSKQIITCLELGQLTPLAFLLLSVMFIAYIRGRDYWTGFLQSVLFLLKLPLGIFMLYFLYKRKYKTLISCCFSLVSFATASLLLFGTPLHREYIKYVFKMNGRGTLLAYNNQSIFAFIARLLSTPQFHNWNLVSFPPFLYYGIVFCALVLVVSLLYRMPRSNAAPSNISLVELSIVTCLAVLLSPISWDHYYMFLIVPFFVAYTFLRQNFSYRGFCALVISLILVNFPTFPSLLQKISILATRYPSAINIISSPFIGGMVLLAYLASTYHRYQYRANHT